MSLRAATRAPLSSSWTRPCPAPISRWKISNTQRLLLLQRPILSSPTQLTRRPYSSITSKPQTSKRKQERKTRKWWFIGGTAIATVAIILSSGTSRDRSFHQNLTELLTGNRLNDCSFEPFSIIDREVVSPTSFIITVQPSHAARSADSWTTRLTKLLGLDTHPNRDVFAQAWDHGLWHIEVKHPLIQVARDYTPLPPRPGDAVQELDRGILRFLIRTVDGGEVSHYLAGLKLGDTIELRGPHLGFDVRTRLGGADRIVFVAGGTGVAPALQVVHAVLGRESSGPKPLVSVLWANRKASDCLGCGLLSAKAVTGKLIPNTSRNAIVADLAEMQELYGNRLQVSCAVDEERVFIDTAAIKAAIGDGGADKSAVTSQTNARPCWYHSTRYLAMSDGQDPAGGHCDCPGEQGTQPHGKRLAIVSGPGGFVSAFAGPTRWTDGKELQGPVGGVLGDLQKKHPALQHNWLVMKL